MALQSATATKTADMLSSTHHKYSSLSQKLSAVERQAICTDMQSPTHHKHSSLSQK